MVYVNFIGCIVDDVMIVRCLTTEVESYSRLVGFCINVIVFVFFIYRVKHEHRSKKHLFTLKRSNQANDARSGL